jgi:L-alanine-DL-glutamate epimerase-like enolase superfamily enzyme
VIAYHDGTRRDLAVAAEAYTLAGFHDGAINIAHASRDATLERVEAARRGRPKRLLRADARGMLNAVSALADAGLLTYSNCAEARRQRWLARGGHDLADYA